MSTLATWSRLATAVDWLTNQDLAFRVDWRQTVANVTQGVVGSQQWLDHLANDALRRYQDHLDRQQIDRLVAQGITDRAAALTIWEQAQRPDLYDAVAAQRQIRDWLSRLEVQG